MKRGEALLTASSTVLLVGGITLLTVYGADLRWVLAVIAAGVAYASVSPLVVVRRLYFLAGGLVHSALLAVALSLPATLLVGGSVYLWSMVIAYALLVGFQKLVEKGVDVDKATAGFVAFTAASSVIAIYYVKTAYPYTLDLWAYILGDPLLADWELVSYALLVSAATLGLVVLTYWEQICIGVDRVGAQLAGLRVAVYDYLLLALLTMTAVGLLRVVGFVLAHVFLLLPGSIAALVASSAGRALPLSLLVTASAAIAGLGLGVMFDLAPSGVIGLVVFGLYVASVLAGRR